MAQSSEIKLLKRFDQDVEITGTLTVGGSEIDFSSFLTSFTETDPTVPSHVKSITTTNISNWNTAYGWGNHANAGYLTSLPSHNHDSLYIKRLGDVTITNFDTLPEGVAGSNETTATNQPYANHNITITLDNDASAGRKAQVFFGDEPGGGMRFRLRQGDTIGWHPWEKVITTANISSQSVSYANNAGTLDGIDSSSFLRSDQDDTTSGSLYFSSSTNSGRIYSDSWGLKVGTDSGYINFGPANSSWAHIYTDRPAFYFNRDIYVNNFLVWNSNNDGSGSGLDADKLDGLHATDFVQQLSDASSPNYQTPSSRRVDPNASNPTNEHYAISTFGNGGNVTGQLAVHLSNGLGYLRSHNNSWSAWRKIWTDANDGAGSGLDADRLDGLDSSEFLRSNTSDTMSGTLTLNGNLKIGTSGNQNYITFYGTTGDTSNYGTTYIGERIYGGTEQSELILYKGNDGQASAASPDRIRMIGANLCFDVYNIAQSYPSDLNGVGALSTTRAMTIIENGSVGIGTAAPQARLHVIAPSTANDEIFQEWSYGSAYQDRYSLMLKQTVTSGVVRYNFSMVNDNTAYNDVLILDRGKVGIGITSPIDKLHVLGSTRFTGNVVVDTSTGADALYITRSGATSQALKIFTDDATCYLEAIQDENTGQYGSVQIALDAGGVNNFFSVSDGVNGTSRLYISNNGNGGYFNSGNFGIGTTSPSKRLHVRSDANEGIFMEGTGGGHWFNFKSGTSNLWSMGAQNGLMGWYNRTDSTYKMVITDSGNVGIGLTNPTVPLQVSGKIYTDNKVQASTAVMGTYSGYAMFGSNSSGTGVAIGRDGANFDLYVTSAGNIVLGRGSGDGNGRRFLSVEGGNLTGSANPVTGALKIALPTARYGSNTMLTFKVVIYEYTTGETYEYRISGYNYSDHAWRNVAVIATTDSGVQHNVRWGNDGSRECVWIGETNTTWSYPQAYITELTVGYSGFSFDGWADGWDMSWVTSFNTVTQSRLPSRLGRNLVVDTVSVGENNIGDGVMAVRGGDLILDRGKELRWTNATGSGEYIYSKTSAPYDVTIHSGAYDALQCPNTGQVRINYQGAQKFVTTASGVSITGTMTASGDVVAYSDIRVKENIKTINNALDKVNALRGVEFNKIGDTKKNIGVIAQEIEKVLPEVVREEDDGMKAVAYGNIVGVLIEAVKELSNKVEELENKLNGTEL